MVPAGGAGMDLGLRDWLESIAGIKRKFVEELHPVLEEQHVADVDDLRAPLVASKLA